ncbi:putative transcription factor bHLH family [Rosa chinensis]|uniref:Putative transcription factor bHLH family n=1 Tax=Rosa chinensis TaxID=74649 RepID=A0A2P6SNT0_ROSCH|nr:transcription factor SPEECHLESS [Rosa chinensis]PRQ60340.1 putative transcription factor bHLH family [Rosa chinensis]
MDDHLLSEFFEEHDHCYGGGDASSLAPGDDLFSILDSLDAGSLMDSFPPPTPCDELVFSSSKEGGIEVSPELETSPKSCKRVKLSKEASPGGTGSNSDDGQQRMSHITVERNRRKQMNEHLTVLRSLMPCFYVKRGDQASIIGGVVDYINELQQVLQSLEAKKQRKAYSEVLSPRLPVSSSPRLPSSPLVLSPRKPPISPLASPRISCSSLPISPRTPQPTSPYKPPRTTSLQQLQQPVYLSSPTITAASSSLEPSPSNSSTTNFSSVNHVIDNLNELFANSKSAIAHVEVKFSGANVLLNTVSPRIPGQALKIISALEDLSLEILHVEIKTEDEKMLNSFTIKIGIECQLSAEELAHQIQQTFR